MKIKQHSVLVTITGIFVAFTLGFFLGRNYNHSDIQLSSVNAAQPTAASTLAPDSPETQPPEAAVSQTEAIPPETQAPAPETEPPQTEATASHSEAEPSQAETEVPQGQASGLININTATRAELESLPGIGEVLAQRIIDYREAYGPFTSVTQLTNVSGIGEKRLAAIIDLVTVG